MKISLLFTLILLVTANTYGQYDRVEPFYSGLAAVKLNRKWGFIDSNQKLIIPCIFDDEYEFNDNGGSWNQAKAPRFQGDFCNINLGWDNSHNVIDKLGRTLLPWCRVRIDIPGENQLSAILTIDNKFAIIDSRLSIISNTFFDEIFPNVGPDLNEGSRNFMIFDDNIKNIRVRKNGYYGYLINRGYFIIPCIFDYAEDFKNGKAKVKQNGIEFLIDEKGNKIK
jgi:hypothetical protein